MGIFSSTLNQIAFLFTFILIGYFLAKKNFIDSNAARVLAKLENFIFLPALSLKTFMNNFTIEKLSSAGILFIAGLVMLWAAAIPAGLFLSRLFSKDKYMQKIYAYGLSFANFGFMGNAVVSAIFPDVFMEYLMFTAPLQMSIYAWAIPVLLVPSENEKSNIGERIKSFINPIFICMIIGMLLGVTGIKLPKFLESVVSASADCMSPVAMLLTGMTVSVIDLKATFLDRKLYIASFIRLVIIPLIFIGAAAFIYPLPPVLFTCALCTLSMPLGINTIVIPAAYDKDTSAAAGMAVISHLLAIITIPLIFSIASGFVA